MPHQQEWIKKMWSIYIMEYNSAIRRSNIVPLSATWIDLEIVFLSEVSQTEKEKFCITSLIHGI